MNINKNNIINFPFAFNPAWSEEDLLLKFRSVVKTKEYLFSNNKFKTQKPIKIVKSFYDMNKYIQSFNFPKENHPIYFSIAIPLKMSYEKHKNKNYMISFNAYWYKERDISTYAGKHQLPKDGIIYWTEKKVSKEQFNDSFINSTFTSSETTIDLPNINIQNENYIQLIEQFKNKYFFDGSTWFEYQKYHMFVWSPVEEKQILLDIIKTFLKGQICYVKAEEILNNIKYQLIPKNISYSLCKTGNKIIDLSKNVELPINIVNKDKFLVYYTPYNIIKK